MHKALKNSILTALMLLLFVGAASAATIVVSAGGNLQAAINNAQRGDVIIVEAGASFRGPIELPAKAGTAEIVIQSSRVSELPNGRVGPAHSPLMPKILCPAFDQAIRTKPGASFYTFVGIEVLPDPSVVEEPNVIKFFDLIRFGDGRNAQTTLESVSHHLKIDRSYIHGLPASSFQRGLSLNSSDSEVTRSYFSEIHGLGFDSQAICSWNTPGRNKIVDNYLEAASENILLGGSDPFSVDFIPTGDQILRNYVFKPLTYKGKGWAVKNLLELKNARNTVIDGNVFEDNWPDGQSGIAILFTVRNQDGTAPYSTIENITFTNNTVKSADGALNLLGSDNLKPSQRATGLLVGNNLFVDIRGPFLIMNGYYNFSLINNTFLQAGNTATLYGEQSLGFVARDNLTIENPYGIFGDGGLIGKAALDRWTPGYDVTGNVLANLTGHPYSLVLAGNFNPTTLTLTSDFRAPDWPGKGVDIDALNAAQAVAGPVSSPSPTPSPSVSPSPSPSATPLPSPVVETRELIERAWPADTDKAGQRAVYSDLMITQRCNDPLVTLLKSGNVIRCWRVKQ